MQYFNTLVTNFISKKSMDSETPASGGKEIVFSSHDLDEGTRDDNVVQFSITASKEDVNGVCNCDLEPQVPNNDTCEETGPIIDNTRPIETLNATISESAPSVEGEDFPDSRLHVAPLVQPSHEEKDVKEEEECPVSPITNICVIENHETSEYPKNDVTEIEEVVPRRNRRRRRVRLSRAVRAEIRIRHTDGASYTQLQSDYNCSSQLIMEVTRNLYHSVDNLDSDLDYISDGEHSSASAEESDGVSGEITREKQHSIERYNNGKVLRPELRFLHKVPSQNDKLLASQLIYTSILAEESTDSPGSSSDAKDQGQKRILRATANRARRKNPNIDYYIPNAGRDANYQPVVISIKEEEKRKKGGTEGEDPGSRKKAVFTRRDRAKIRALHRSGISIGELCSQYQCSISPISNIINNYTRFERYKDGYDNLDSDKEHLPGDPLEIKGTDGNVLGENITLSVKRHEQLTKKTSIPTPLSVVMSFL